MSTETGLQAGGVSAPPVAVAHAGWWRCCGAHKWQLVLTAPTYDECWDALWAWQAKRGGDRYVGASGINPNERKA